MYFWAYAGISVSARKADRNAPISVTAVLEDRTDQMTDKYQQEWNGFWHFFNVMQFLEKFVAVSAVGLDQMVYAGLKVPSAPVMAQVSEEDMAISRDDGWDDILDQLFEEEAIAMARKLRDMHVAAPDEAGYELADSKGAVLSTMELVWSEKKLGFMTEEQTEFREAAEKAGWRIFTADDKVDNTMFGGEN